ncbi:MAG: SGNH/GDSL hydrolase family protein [Syntrophaceae bacterium]|nr:SGNH/GDSL hydrolase family protein [Syntrophaceae bacterium]
MEKSITRNILIKIIAMTLPFLFFVCALEIFLRFFGPEYHKFNYCSYEYYSNPRGYHLPIRKEGNKIVYGLDYRESRKGYRLPDHKFDQPDKNNRIVSEILVIGDSFTYGRGVKYEDIYTTRLSEMLKINGYRTTVKNCGVVGADVGDVTKVLSSEMLQKTYPVVVYGFVLDDFGRSLKVKGSDFIDINNEGNRWSTLRNISKIANLIIHYIEKKRLSKETTKAYIEAFKGKNAEVGIQLIDDINRKIKQRGGKLVIMLFPLLYKFDNYPFMEIHEKIASVCAKNNIPMLDLLPVYSAYKYKDLWANPTDQHPNEIAHKVAAVCLYNFLVERKLIIHKI